MAQTVRPTGDKAAGAWLTAPLWSKINDASDATYIESDDAAINYVEVYLGDISPPGAGTVTLYVRALRWDPQGNIKIDLVEDPDGTPVVRATLPDTALSAGPTFLEYSYNLTAGEVASITDWTDLSLRIYQNLNNRQIAVADVWLVAPDPPNIAVDGGSVTVTGGTADLQDSGTGPSLDAEGGSITTSGGTADLQVNPGLAAAAGSVTTSGGTIVPHLETVEFGNLGVIAVTGGDADLQVIGNSAIFVEGGSVAVTGGTADLQTSGDLISVSGGTVDVTGASVSFDVNVPLGAGSIDVTGGTMTPHLETVEFGNLGVILVTGGDADLTVLDQNNIDVEGGSVAVTGGNASLVVSGISVSDGSVVVTGAALVPSITEEGTVGVIDVTGGTVNLTVGPVLLAAGGTVTVSGQNAGLAVGADEFISVTGGSVAVTGGDARLAHSPVLHVDAGSVAVTGDAMSPGINLPLEAGAVTLPGGLSTWVRFGLGIDLGAGSIDVTGQAAGLGTVGNKALSADAGAVAVTGGGYTYQYDVATGGPAEIPVEGHPVSFSHAGLPAEGGTIDVTGGLMTNGEGDGNSGGTRIGIGIEVALPLRRAA